jgi:hypothetical protein
MLTMTCDDNELPPRLARAGADRCIKRNVVMNADEPWDAMVRYESAPRPIEEPWLLMLDEWSITARD